MQKIICSVYDLKSQLFSNPFISINTQVAQRDFAAAANDPNSQINHFPSDFILYHIGDFDDTSGVISLKDIRTDLGTALSFVQPIPIKFEEVS